MDPALQPHPGALSGPPALSQLTRHGNTPFSFACLFTQRGLDSGHQGLQRDMVFGLRGHHTNSELTRGSGWDSDAQREGEAAPRPIGVSETSEEGAKVREAL